MGLLSALGGLFQSDEDRASGNLNGLQRFGMALNDDNGPVDQNVLAKLAQLRNQGVTDPQQIIRNLAQYDPKIAEKAAQYQAQNPLLALLGNNDQQSSLANLSGDDLLSKLPAGIATQVKGYAEGKIPFNPYTLRTQQGQQMMQLVGQYDPNFDAVNYNARSSTRKDFTSGKAAQNITALNTAIGHISTLQDAAAALDNTSFPTVNSIVNTVKTLTGNEEVKNFDTAKTAVADELERVFRGTGGSVTGIQEWKKNLDAANSPEQFKGVMNQMTELLNSRLDSLGEQYNQGMGTTKQGIELLSPKAQKAYQKITGQAPSKTEVSGNLNADNQPVTQKPTITKEEAIAELKRRGKL